MTLDSILNFISSVVKGLSFVGAFLFGRKTVELKEEKKARKNAEERASAWANRPRSGAELVNRLRKFAKRKE